MLELLEKVPYYPPSLQLTEIHVHHAVISANKYDGSNGDECVSEVRKIHVEGNKWSDIGYHFLAFKDGLWLPGRNLRRRPASASGHNGKYDNHPLAICCYADFRTDEKSDGFVEAIAQIRVLHRPWASVLPFRIVPHHAMQATWCPMPKEDWPGFLGRIEKATEDYDK